MPPRTFSVIHRGVYMNIVGSGFLEYSRLYGVLNFYAIFLVTFMHLHFAEIVFYPVIHCRQNVNMSQVANFKPKSLQFINIRRQYLSQTVRKFWQTLHWNRHIYLTNLTTLYITVLNMLIPLLAHDNKPAATSLLEVDSAGMLTKWTV